MFEINKNITGFIEDMTYREQPYLFRMKRRQLILCGRMVLCFRTKVLCR